MVESIAIENHLTGDLIDDHTFSSKFTLQLVWPDPHWQVSSYNNAWNRAKNWGARRVSQFFIWPFRFIFHFQSTIMGSVPAKQNYNRRCFWKVKSFEFWTAFALLPGRVERRTIDMKNEEEKSKMENWKWTFSLQGQWRAPNLHFLFYLFVCMFACIDFWQSF